MPVSWAGTLPAHGGAGAGLHLAQIVVQTSFGLFILFVSLVPPIPAQAWTRGRRKS